MSLQDSGNLGDDPPNVTKAAKKSESFDESLLTPKKKQKNALKKIGRGIKILLGIGTKSLEVKGNSLQSSAVVIRPTGPKGRRLPTNNLKTEIVSKDPENSAVEKSTDDKKSPNPKRKALLPETAKAITEETVSSEQLISETICDKEPELVVVNEKKAILPNTKTITEEESPEEKCSEGEKSPDNLQTTEKENTRISSVLENKILFDTKSVDSIDLKVKDDDVDISKTQKVETEQNVISLEEQTSSTEEPNGLQISTIDVTETAKKDSKSEETDCTVVISPFIEKDKASLDQKTPEKSTTSVTSENASSRSIDFSKKSKTTKSITPKNKTVGGIVTCQSLDCIQADVKVTNSKLKNIPSYGSFDSSKKKTYPLEESQKASDISKLPTDRSELGIEPVKSQDTEAKNSQKTIVTEDPSFEKTATIEQNNNLESEAREVEIPGTAESTSNTKIDSIKEEIKISSDSDQPKIETTSSPSADAPVVDCKVTKDIDLVDKIGDTSGVASIDEAKPPDGGSEKAFTTPLSTPL